MTASTVFWEGITIKDLKLLLIFDPPYPRPSITDLIREKVITDKRDMTRRLEQGLGRIGRRKGEWGVGITLFDFSRIGYLCSIKGKQFKIRTWECFPLLQKLMAHEKQRVFLNFSWNVKKGS